MSCESDDAKALASIEEFGCHVLHVTECEAAPCFTYSIGIERTSCQPELLVTGLPPKIGTWIVNEYNDRVRAGEIFAVGTLYPGFLEGFDVLFQPILKRYYKDYLGWGIWLYGSDDFAALQLVWPSTTGVWPWSAEATVEHKQMHPMLCDPVKDGLVQCPMHGAAHETFVCEHLVGAKGMGWNSAAVTDGNRFPDAWCDQCHLAFESEGEWNDVSIRTAAMQLKILCHHCYQNAKNNCTSRVI